MARGKWRQKRDSLISRDHLLWEMVCRTTIPLRDKLPSFISENADNTDNKRQRITQILPFSQGNQQKLSIIKRKKETVTKEHKVYFFDRVAHRKITKGHYPIEARLDLHGCVQEEAYFFLKKFLQSSQQSGLRYVLVITGKGRSRGSNGILYHFVPHWLSTPAFRCYVHAFEQAARQHGGDGALYIRLRRCIPEKRI
ncbi:Smr/MutS family protein [Bartonella sp. B35(2025)]